MDISKCQERRNSIFFFGYNTNQDGQIVLDDIENFRVALSSKRLFKNFDIQSIGIYHIDNTYKTNKSRFPFLVFGRSDYSGQFHPIAVAVIKREREDDYKWFLNSMKCFCLQHLEINIESKIQYAMMDACDPEYNAVSAIFPKTIILMCWFHVMKNVKENLKSFKVPDELSTMVKSDISDLHCSLSFDEFKYTLERIKIKWSQYKALADFTAYFIKEWCHHNGNWSRWCR